MPYQDPDKRTHTHLMTLVAMAREQRQLFWMRAMLMQARRMRLGEEI